MFIWLTAFAIAIWLLIWLLPKVLRKALRWSILVSSWIAEELPIAWIILLCILFPPTLLVLLVAMGCHQLGMSQKILDATEPKASRRKKEQAAKEKDKTE